MAIWKPLLAVAVVSAAPGDTGVVRGDGGMGEDPVLGLGRRLSADFWAGRLDQVWAAMGTEMRAVLKSPEGLATAREQLLAMTRGASGDTQDEQLVFSKGQRVYVRTFTVADGRRWLEQWGSSDGHTVTAFLVRPAKLEAAATRFDGYQAKNTYRLPVRGTWWVGWGGHSLEQNQHALIANQRFAYDLLIRVHSQTWRADAKAPSDFLAWDQPILALADGTVVSATDGLPDSAPGVPDQIHKEGNVVIIDHGQGEWSMVAHLKQGSVRVRPGQRVKAGEEIARCGSSGNASEPHLHVQLMNAPDFWKAEGLPLPFTHLVIDGKRVEKAELVRGQTISPGP